ncbi:MAG: cob(I)yrinic acid a,c-diamide adenosyltransferase [Bacteroidaceae bacterium]|nr:cob(I)yrinic acid a,c-diamide adenosyltransferase [Bacteroidaceae bacterium]
MDKKSKIYTRGGDTGTTSLIGGKRVKKCALCLESYGTIDELSAHIGLLASMIKTDSTLHIHTDSNTNFLEWLQSRLFDAGTHLAMPCRQLDTPSPCSITEKHLTHLESIIDQLDAHLEPLHSFILPGGCIEAAQCHVCRTVCRRAERLITALAEEAPVSLMLQSFINRLSDFFFIYARFINKMKHADEISWKNDCN